jgi:aspartyl-tRNA(Asn)/glutamyl-tRNA(Gln) amidotransferase subunit B
MTRLKVGLEIHVYPYMENKTKLFCNCPIELNATPNTNICEICTSQPGAHPMLPNREAILKSLMISKILSCKTDERPAFQRKHYSWPDLPSGYQRTMSGAYAKPMATQGIFRGIRIMQVHLEEDPARWDPETGTVDYNRCGTPLVEIVTEPDFTSKEQVRKWLEELRLHLDHAGCFDERFGIKADVNVSVEPAYDRIEIKNINSFSAITDAIEYEHMRQAKEVEAQGKIAPKTMAWTGTQTIVMRAKEGSSDYRFIPEQDLPRIIIEKEMEEEANDAGSIDISAMHKNLIEEGMHAEDANVMIQNPVLYRHAIIMIQNGISADDAGRFLRRELLRVTNYHNAHPRSFKGSSKSMVDLLILYQKSLITDMIMKRIMEALYAEDFDVRAYVDENSLLLVSDETELEKAVDDAITSNPKAADDYRSGKMESLNFISGQVMRAMKGKADIKKTQELIRKKLS